MTVKPLVHYRPGFTIVDTTCTDHDHECPDVVDKVACYLYDPQRGMCPYLRSESPSQPTQSGD
jgi:hypothetical protein